MPSLLEGLAIGLSIAFTGVMLALMWVWVIHAMI